MNLKEFMEFFLFKLWIKHKEKTEPCPHFTEREIQTKEAGLVGRGSDEK